MKKNILLSLAAAGLVIASVGATLILSGTSRRAQAADAPAASTTAPSTTARGSGKEPVASADEFKSHVIRQVDLPSVELVPGSNSRLVAGEQSMLSFLTMDKNSYFAPHRHRQEQIMIVLDGYCDEIIEGKLYRVKAGDVVILPSNIEHGAYIRDQDVHVIDVFGDVRADYLLKMMQAMAAMNTKK
jgi:quercetin dioxygenase-like cupin family protein